MTTDPSLADRKPVAMRHHTILLAAALAALTACQVDESLGDAHGVLFGVAAATYMTDEATQEAAFTSVEQTVGRTFALDRIFRQWDNARPGAREQWTIEKGRTPIVSFKTIPKVPWSAIASGAHDTELAAIAEGYRELMPAQVFCIFDQDPENSGGALGTPEDYAEAYRHIVTTFQNAGVSNVMWIFNLKSITFLDGALVDRYYPKDDYIDWIGTSAYNFVRGPGARPTSFDSLITDFVKWAKPHGKHLIITEWNSDEDPDDPTARATWIDEAAKAVPGRPEIRAMSAFWSVADGTGFDSSALTLDAFIRFATDRYTNLRKPQSAVSFR